MKHNNLSSHSYRTTRSVLTGKTTNNKLRDTRKSNSPNNHLKLELLYKLNSNNSSSVRDKFSREFSRRCKHHNQSISGSPKTPRQRLCSRKSSRPSKNHRLNRSKSQRNKSLNAISTRHSSQSRTSSRRRRASYRLTTHPQAVTVMAP